MVSLVSYHYWCRGLEVMLEEHVSEGAIKCMQGLHAFTLWAWVFFILQHTLRLLTNLDQN